MAIFITGSVGQGGLNHPNDVRTVYALFNNILLSQLNAGDQCSPELIQAIKDFQQAFMSRPDGRIDVEGQTWRTLTEARRPENGKSVFISFDDGPAPTSALHSILETLDRHGIKAEFYVLGQEVDNSPTAAKEIAKRGHKVQNHFYSHLDLAKASKYLVRKELKKAQESIEKAAGVTPTRIRPPYGAGGWPSGFAEVAAELSLIIHNWDIDTEDCTSPKGIGSSKLAMIKRQFAIQQNKTEFNVLMHVTKETAEDLGNFIDQLRKWGFSFGRP